MYKFIIELYDTYGTMVADWAELADRNDIFNYIVSHYSDSINNRGWSITGVYDLDYFDDLDDLKQSDIITLQNLVSLGNSIIKARRAIYKTTPIEKCSSTVK